jgi:hypothetical protein
MLPTSYFSNPSTTLDPTIFDDEKRVRSEIRAGLLTPLMAYLEGAFNKPERWVHAWIAGSGASYQWAAARDPGDLDVLLGVDFIKFRQHNPGFVGFSDEDTAEFLNANLREVLSEHMRGWNGYDVTYFINPDSKDIKAINPYAAYDLTLDRWDVDPDPNQRAPEHHDWERRAQADSRMAQDIVARYSAAISAVSNAQNPAHRMNAEVRLRDVLGQAEALFNDIHEGRHVAFSRVGKGYADYSNFRWQAGKARGTVQALREIRDYAKYLREESEESLYGIELPDTQTLIRRAAMAHVYNGDF